MDTLGWDWITYFKDSTTFKSLKIYVTYLQFLQGSQMVWVVEGFAFQFDSIDFESLFGGKVEFCTELLSGDNLATCRLMLIDYK